jgi:hypothetical protein
MLQLHRSQELFLPAARLTSSVCHVAGSARGLDGRTTQDQKEGIEMSQAGDAAAKAAEIFHRFGC